MNHKGLLTECTIWCFMLIINAERQIVWTYTVIVAVFVVVIGEGTQTHIR